MDGSGTSTAVRIGADGQVATCELDLLGAVGADDEGVWTGPDPHLAMEDGLGSEQEADDAEQKDQDQGAVPQWVRDGPVTSWEDYGRAEREAADALVPGDVEQFEAASLQIGEGESFGWFAYPPGQEPEDPELLPDPPPPAPTGPVTLRRVRADGGADQVVVSRVVSRIEAVGAQILRLVFHPTGPLYTADGGGGHFVDYPRRVAEIDLADELPASIDLDAAPSQPLQEEDWDEEDWLEPVTAESDRVDLSGIAGTRWALRALGQGKIEETVQAVVEQYAALDEPHIVWTKRDNSWQRVQSEFADVHVHVEGRWPTTEVIVDFTYRPAPGASLRRRTRVFDDTGAPAISPHLTIYLDEDLATTDLDRLPVDEGRRLI